MTQLTPIRVLVDAMKPAPTELVGTHLSNPISGHLPVTPFSLELEL